MALCLGRAPCRAGHGVLALLLSFRVPEALAQSATHSHIQRAATTRFLQAGLGGLLQTHWAQWRTALFRARLERRARAQEAERRLWPGSLPLLLDTPDPWMQVRWGPAIVGGPKMALQTTGCRGGWFPSHPWWQYG